MNKRVFVLLLMIGILGAYLGQVLREVQRRPPYVIREASHPPRAR